MSEREAETTETIDGLCNDLEAHVKLRKYIFRFSLTLAMTSLLVLFCLKYFLTGGLIAIVIGLLAVAICAILFHNLQSKYSNLFVDLHSKDTKIDQSKYHALSAEAKGLFTRLQNNLNVLRSQT